MEKLPLPLPNKHSTKAELAVWREIQDQQMKAYRAQYLADAPKREAANKVRLARNAASDKRMNIGVATALTLLAPAVGIGAPVAGVVWFALTALPAWGVVFHKD